ncbi:MAG TPA: isoprenylcysteine carboxylmethyltransferase family protein [Terriglobales bacterium]|nr:isoprenylcysteine carboxylmethyltransferase family protein [Terriglobales bacterium]
MNRQARFFTVVPPVAIAYLLWVFRPAAWDVMHIAGLVFTIFGIGLLTLARYQLGNSFSVTPQARVLVTTGLYSRIRNPVYVFGAIGIAGFILYLGRPRVLLIFLILIPMQIYRAHQEALVLEAKFGDHYRAWRRQTWF